jgi:hypothetical protein
MLLVGNLHLSCQKWIKRKKTDLCSTVNQQPLEKKKETTRSMKDHPTQRTMCGVQLSRNAGLHQWQMADPTGLGALELPSCFLVGFISKKRLSVGPKHH